MYLIGSFPIVVHNWSTEPELPAWERELHERSAKQHQRLRKKWNSRGIVSTVVSPLTCPTRIPFQIHRCEKPDCEDRIFDSESGLKMHIMAFDACAARLNRLGRELDLRADGEHATSIESFKCDILCGHHKGIDPDEFPHLWNPRRCRQIRKSKKRWSSTMMDDWAIKTCMNCNMEFGSKAQFEYHLLKRQRKPYLCVNIMELAWRSRRLAEQGEASLNAFYKKMYEARGRVTPLTPLAVGNPRDSDFASRSSSNRTKRVLPLTIGQNTLDTCADTGSAYNIIAQDTVEKLGLRIETDPTHLKTFELADGRIVHSIGKVREYCSFPDYPGIRSRCTFFVWEKCSTPVIMGRRFLDKHKVMETPKRFIERTSLLSNDQSLPIVRLIGTSHKQLPCYIDGKLISANPDSGSDLDLMSARFARVSGYKINRQKRGRARMRLADGTTAESIGYVEKEIVIGDGKRTYLKRFQILPGLRSDVLLGDSTLLEAGVFDGQHMVTPHVKCCRSPCIPDCATLIYLSSAEKFFVDSMRRFKRLFRKLKDDPPSSITLADDQRARDAREVHRRLQEQERITKLLDDDRKLAEGLEKSRREKYAQCRHSS